MEVTLLMLKLSQTFSSKFQELCPVLIGPQSVSVSTPDSESGNPHCTCDRSSSLLVGRGIPLCFCAENEALPFPLQPFVVT
eukprot:6474139-Amphidinium_carterae.2